MQLDEIAVTLTFTLPQDGKHDHVPYPYGVVFRPATVTVRISPKHMQVDADGCTVKKDGNPSRVQLKPSYATYDRRQWPACVERAVRRASDLYATAVNAIELDQQEATE